MFCTLHIHSKPIKILETFQNVGKSHFYNVVTCVHIFVISLKLYTLDIVKLVKFKYNMYNIFLIIWALYVIGKIAV